MATERDCSTYRVDDATVLHGRIKRDGELRVFCMTCEIDDCDHARAVTNAFLLSRTEQH